MIRQGPRGDTWGRSMGRAPIHVSSSYFNGRECPPNSVVSAPFVPIFFKMKTVPLMTITLARNNMKRSQLTPSDPDDFYRPVVRGAGTGQQQTLEHGLLPSS